VRQEINQICRQLRQTNSPHDLVQSPQEFRIVQIIPQEALRGKQADERPQVRNRPTGELRNGVGNPSWIEFIEHLVILRQLRLVVGDELGIEQQLDEDMTQKMRPKTIIGRKSIPQIPAELQRQLCECPGIVKPGVVMVMLHYAGGNFRQHGIVGVDEFCCLPRADPNFAIDDAEPIGDSRASEEAGVIDPR
jgi:hypothetical protein